MSSDNLKGSLNENTNDARQKKAVINSIDYTYAVQRLPVFRSSWQGIYLYGLDNNYPTKVQEIAKRSPTLETAIQTHTKFIKGLGFEGATPLDVISGKSPILNSDGLTAYDFLTFLAKEKSNINIAVHVNYNALGEAVEFTPIPYEFIRKKIKLKGEKYKQLIITNFFHLENEINLGYGVAFSMENFQKWKEKKEDGTTLTALKCYEYNNNPVIVREQIELSGGIENYSGQIYYKNNENSVYQRANYDVVLDSAQYESEADLYSLSNIQNRFSASGVLKLPDNVSSKEELDELKLKLRNLHGSEDAGRTFVIPFLPSEPIPNNIFESFELQNIDKLFTLQKAEAQASIRQKYNIPNALIGKDSEGNFATQRVQEMFDFFNAMTEPVRKELEVDINVLLSNSIFKNQFKFPITIDPLTYYIEKKEEEKETENKKVSNENID